MKYYELTCLISPDLSEEELKTFSQKISNFVLEETGKLERVITPIRKKLGYPIKERMESFLFTLNFHLSPEKLEGLEKKLKPESQILRYIILTKKVPEKVPMTKPLRITKKITELSKATAYQPKAGKVELKDIDKKIEEILGE